MIKGIDHIGIVVKDLEKAIEVQEKLGLTVSGREDIAHLHVSVAFFQIGDTRIELVSPASEEHELMDHMNDKGEGIHHVAYSVRDLATILKRCNEKGINVDPTRPRGKGHGGKEIAFLDPRDTRGFLIELCQQ